MCVHMLRSVGVCVCVCARGHAQVGSEINVRWHSSCTVHLGFWETAFHGDLSWGSQATCLCLPSVRITSLCLHVQLFYVGSGTQTHITD